MTTLLEQARKINQERQYPYYIQHNNSQFVAKHNGPNCNAQVFNTLEEAREFIQDTVIEDSILQAESRMDIY